MERLLRGFACIGAAAVAYFAVLLIVGMRQRHLRSAAV
jgi:hypothetical protein